MRGEFGLDVRFPHRLGVERYRDWTFWDEFIRLATFIPDVWWEFGDGFDDGVALSVPLAFSLDAGDHLASTLFVEPQYRPDSSQFRAMAGNRVMWAPIAENFGPLLEGGGVLGADGAGATFGSGIVLFYEADYDGTASTISAVYRRTSTSDQSRHAVSLDLQYAPGL